MRAYWDSFALVLATADIGLRRRLHEDRGITRSHALSEISFATDQHDFDGLADSINIQLV